MLFLPYFRQYTVSLTVRTGRAVMLTSLTLDDPGCQRTSKTKGLHKYRPCAVWRMSTLTSILQCCTFLLNIILMLLSLQFNHSVNQRSTGQTTRFQAVFIQFLYICNAIYFDITSLSECHMLTMPRRLPILGIVNDYWWSRQSVRWLLCYRYHWRSTHTSTFERGVIEE